MLVIPDLATVMVFAHALAQTGPDSEVMNIVLEDLELLGHREIAFKGDQEPSIKRVRSEEAARRPGIKLDNSPVGASPANGLLENAVKRVIDLTRRITDSLEYRIGGVVVGHRARGVHHPPLLHRARREDADGKGPGDEGHKDLGGLRREGLVKTVAQGSGEAQGQDR